MMLIYTLDDEDAALRELTAAVRAVNHTAEIRQFNTAGAALAAITEGTERPNVVFSDIAMPGMDGIRFAEELRTESPMTKLVFVTEHAERAAEAFRVRANGFIVKPVSPESIREELEYLQPEPFAEPPRLRVQCFGNFEVFWDDMPLTLKRRNTKELFAYLIDRNGAVVTAEEATAILWEDEPDISKAKHNLRNLVNDLRTALCEIGRPDVLIRGSGTMAINKNAVDCDYYRLLEGDETAAAAFRGEYMNQYPWARATEAGLHFTR
jgi:two-component SAPR family response regulator